MVCLGDPTWEALVTGQLVDLVFETDHSGSFVDTWHGGLLQCATLTPGNWSVFRFRVTAVQDRILTIEATAESIAIPKPKLCLTSFLRIKETCSGIGGISIGAAFAGCHTLLFSERSQIACQTLRLNKGFVVEGDISSPEIRARIAQHHADSSCILVAGFPCQPYSRQGLGLGLADPRGQTLLYVLQLARQAQVEGLILECVSEVQQYSATMQLLHDFAKRAGFRLAEVVLELGDQWAAKRRRWWGVFTPLSLPALDLLPWPVLAPPTVIKDVLPEWPLWPDVQEKQLAWSASEEAMYMDARFGNEPRIFDLEKQSPTALHSWGSALGPCPCQCRSSGFSVHTLEQRGLRGIGVFSSVLGGFRFPHPAEVGLLNTLPLDFLHLEGMRAALCLVGQVAAPLQALWVYAQVRRWAEQAFTGSSQVDPHQLLQDFKKILLQARRDQWIVPSLQVPCLLWLCKDGVPYTVHVQQPVRARDVLAAELALAGPGFKACIMDGNRRLPAQALLHCNSPEQPYIVCIQEKKAKLQPSAPPSLPAAASSSETSSEVHTVGTSDVAIWTGLMRLQGSSAARPVIVFPPEWVLSMLNTTPASAPSCPVLWPEKAAVCFLPLLDQGHWSLLVVTKDDGGLSGTLYDGIPGRSEASARQLLHQLGLVFGAQVAAFCSATHWVQTDCHSCGLLVLAHAAAFLLGGPSEVILADAASFLAFLPCHSSNMVGHGGLSEAQTRQVSQLLLERGVPENQVAERVQAAVAKIGAGPIAQALTAFNVWQALKAAGSSSAAAFRWVKVEELKAHAEVKASQKFGAAVAKPKTKKSSKAAKGAKLQLQVDPQALQLAPRSFITEGGEPLAQLEFSEVVQQAQGISFCTAQQLLPFIENFQSLSVDALALVATSELPADMCASAPATAVRYPAIYGPTGEAILLKGSLLQLGDETVQLQATDIADIESVDVITGRVSLYRDELSSEWEEVAKSPIRALIQLVPALTLCKDAACKGECQYFHPAVEESVDNVVQDVWARRFSTVDGSKVEAGKAALFQALIRVPSSALKHLQRSTAPGFYFEPRSADGYTAHAGFSVIWLPGKDRGQVLHIARTNERVVAITRINKRFGVRVRDADEPTVHALLKPEVDFIKVRIAARYRLHPLPHGVQRKHLVTLLKQWGWAARPLQVLKGDSSGSAWEVGSDSDPPGQALPAAGGFVLISKLRDTAGQHHVPAITATARTRKHILYDDPDLKLDANSGNVDPWSGGKDPWSAYKAPPGLPAPQATASSTADSKLQKVRGELQASFQKQLEEYTAKHAGEAITDQEQRLQKLEVGMTELHAQNRKFQDWCQTVGGQLSTHSNQIGEVQRAMQAQQAEVGQIRAEVAQTISSSVSNLQQDMSRQLSAQMQQIESLLSKKPRTE